MRSKIQLLLQEKGFAMTFWAIAILLCIYTSIKMQPTIPIILGIIPFLLILTYLSIKKEYIALIIFALVNYFIMGIGRYVNIPIPVSLLFDIIFGFIFATTLLRNLGNKDNFRNIFNLYFAFTLIWFLYCAINVANNATGTIHFTAWLGNVRVIALYAVITSIIISIAAKKYQFIHWFLMLWGILTILAAAKGYMQKNQGFDSAELAWVMTRGYNTHILTTGIRYFSFLTDAANFGCSMGLSLVSFFISSFYTKNKYLIIFYLIVTAGAGYGLLISGTRASMAVPIAGFGLYVFLCKNWKIGLSAAFILIFGILILKYTEIGDGNRLIRRMRTVFDTEDASLQVRFHNQRALKAYMSEIPFGIGLGVDREEVPQQNKFYFVATCPPDSELVYIWIHTGKVGLIVYLVLQVLMYICGCCILLFRVRNPEIRGPLTGMLCGTAGMLVASYANQIYFQFPNGPLIYTCLTLVFLAPYFDKQYSEAHGRPTD